MVSSVVIIGGGIVGCSTAHYLRKLGGEGLRITIIDKVRSHDEHTGTDTDTDTQLHHALCGKRQALTRSPHHCRLFMTMTLPFDPHTHARACVVPKGRHCCSSEWSRWRVLGTGLARRCALHCAPLASTS